MMKKKIICVLGKQFSGKSTIFKQVRSRISKYTIKDLKIKIVNIGENLRKLAETNKEIRDLINVGKFVSNTKIDEIIAENVLKDDEKILFDGFPRNLEQFEKYFGDNAIFKPDKYEIEFIFLEYDESLLNRRIADRRKKQIRDDDKTAAVIKNRIVKSNNTIALLKKKIRNDRMIRMSIEHNNNGFDMQRLTCLILKKIGVDEAIVCFEGNRIVRTESELECYAFLSKIKKKFWHELGENIDRFQFKHEIDDFVGDFCSRNGVSSIKNMFIDGQYWKFHSCVSHGNEVAHSVAMRNVRLLPGLIRVDCVIKHKGLFIDSARTFCYRSECSKQKKMITDADIIMQMLAQNVSVGTKLAEISKLITNFASLNDYFLVPGVRGHAIGDLLHLNPAVEQIFSGQNKYNKFEIPKNCTMCIEPIFTDNRKKLNEVYKRLKEQKKNKDFLTSALNRNIDDLWSLRINADFPINIIHIENTFLFKENRTIVLTDDQ